MSQNDLEQSQIHHPQAQSVDVYVKAKALMNRYGLDQISISECRYTRAVPLPNYPDTYCSLRQNLDRDSRKLPTYTVVVLAIINAQTFEHDLATYTPENGFDGEGVDLPIKTHSLMSALLDQFDISIATSSSDRHQNS